MKHTWTDETGDDGEIEVINNRLFAILGKDSPCFIWTIPTARALHEALGRALAEVDSQPAKETA